MSSICLATRSRRCCFEPMRFERHPAGDEDVTLDVKFCGVCHSDVHQAKDDFLRTKFPICPGHEIAGVVTAVGSKVTKLRVGDHVGVGCMVDSCLECRHCKAGNEQFCVKGNTGTYNADPVHGRAGTATTKGGYSTRMVVHEHFCVVLPKSLPLEKAGPLLCAGITTYSPLRRFAVGPGSRVGVNGLGGLGTMAVKQAKAMGAEVTVITRSARKEAAAKAMGADHVVFSSQPESMKASGGTLDLVVDTVSVRHDIGVNALTPPGLLDLLDANGSWCYCGLILDMQDVQPAKLLLNQVAVTGTAIGGMAVTQECIDFCAQHELYCNTEVVPATPAELSRVYEILDSGNDGGKRYVLAIADTLNEGTFAEPRPPVPNLLPRSRVGLQIAFLLLRTALGKVEGIVLDNAGAVTTALGVGALGAIGAVATIVYSRFSGRG